VGNWPCSFFMSAKKHSLVAFDAHISPLQTAITISSDGGMRIKIDVPEMFIAQAIPLFDWRERMLHMLIYPADSDAPITLHETCLHCDEALTDPLSQVAGLCPSCRSQRKDESGADEAWSF